MSRVFWSIDISEHDISDGDLETIGNMVSEGYTSGEIDGSDNGEDD